MQTCQLSKKYDFIPPTASTFNNKGTCITNVNNVAGFYDYTQLGFEMWKRYSSMGKPLFKENCNEQTTFMQTKCI